MTEIGPSHPITYRQELLTPLSTCIRAWESCAIVGAASMGKSRLLQFLLRTDVRRHYLGDEAERTLLLWADCNRLAAVSEWGLYELILTSLVEASGEHQAATTIRTQLIELRREAIIERSALLAQRHLELAVHMLCHEQGLRLVILLDEFDECYRTLTEQALANLRALRDANKYRLCYVLFLRDHPAQMRPPGECEGFYELLSRSIFGLRPYREDDARRVLAQLQARHRTRLQIMGDETTAQLLRLSGGHPGLLGALVNGLMESPPLGVPWDDWAQKQEDVQDELRKLWEGLRNKERVALNHLALGLSTSLREQESLLLKGLIHEDGSHSVTFFTPLLEQFAAVHAPSADSILRVDLQAGAVYRDGILCGDLTAKEFDLLAYLYQHKEQVCEVEQVIAELYPGNAGFEINANTISALVGRVRRKIEPDPKHPQFLLNVKGRGYRLTTAPE
jgi:hypothetical protein